MEKVPMKFMQQHVDDIIIILHCPHLYTILYIYSYILSYIRNSEFLIKTKIVL